MKEKTKHFPFCPENKVSPQDKLSNSMNETKPKHYIQNKKLICDWTDKKRYVTQYRIIKFYVKHGMIVDKFHGIISFKQSMWLEKDIRYYSKKESSCKRF